MDKENDKDDAQLQTQCVAISEDGINFKKLENNPIINIDSFPEDLNILKEHFRDPKVWKYNDMYYKVVGAQTTEKTGFDGRFNFGIQQRASKTGTCKRS